VVVTHRKFCRALEFIRVINVLPSPLSGRISYEPEGSSAGIVSESSSPSPPVAVCGAGGTSSTSAYTADEFFKDSSSIKTGSGGVLPPLSEPVYMCAFLAVKSGVCCCLAVVCFHLLFFRCQHTGRQSRAPSRCYGRVGHRTRPRTRIWYGTNARCIALIAY
jgi:hypothetical protein